MSQQQQNLLEGGNMDGFRNGGSTGFATGSTCTSSGTYRAFNKYMDNILVVAAGDVFPPFSDGKKTTWYALGPSTKSGFESVRVEAGTI
ncbi:MAG TPA: hypothetical protein VFS76_19890 [Pyrinomonadaceae bacterium]|nr:hypothetical protein [Pyrinomonadaceae bacterium]